VRDVASFHDSVQGTERGENALWLAELDGLRVLHMGDFGQHQLTAEQLAEIGQPDVLMIPVGGTFTIDAATAHNIIDQLQPALVIPMHYLTEAISVPVLLRPVDDFIGHAPDKGPHTITLHKRDLTPGQAQVEVMSYEDN
jgi:L-ascorbate metabolism protein UlaG (beta-lactamase superfamily)